LEKKGSVVTMKKKEQTGFNFFRFPEKLNLTTYFLIIALYTLILAVTIALALPKINYRVVLDYPAGEYNEDINPFLFVRTTPAKASDDEEKIELSYSFYGYIKPVSANKPTKYRLAVSGLDVNETMQFFYESKDNLKAIPLNHHYLNTGVKSEGFKKYFIKIIYNQVLNDEEVFKTLKVSEEVLNLNKKEMKSKKFSEAENEYLEISFRIRAGDDKHDGYVTLDPKNKESDYHINMQSWLVTEDGVIYPFIGIYNYNSKEKFNPNYASTIHKYLNVEYIYAKAEYIDADGKITTIYYKEKLADLLSQ
jgi:hypothetical protein